MTYYSTVPSGLQDVAADALTDGVADRIIAVLDGAVLYGGAASAERVSSLDFVQNSFLVLRSLPDAGAAPMDRLLSEAASLSLDKRKLPSAVVRRARTFRLVTSVENRLVSPNRRLRAAVEESISRSLGLKVNRSGADLEVWLLARREGTGIVGIRLSERRATEKDLGKGELRPELCNLLCRLGSPKASDRFLDPFCGTGAIPAERMRAFPVQSLFGAELDPELVARARRRLAAVRTSGRAPHVSVECGDARELGWIADGSIDSVVSDPPWGNFDGETTDIEGLYRQAVEELCRVMRREATAVLLVGRDGPMEDVVAESGGFGVQGRHEVLVQGRKATVVVARRTE